mmetsp:Transcript_29930/g.75294  ORF Transcript_29930/g.75294 Transcript_29930/m.75294 type:complete len:83 (+) Transcript_29930:267-515(+)
MLQVGWLYEYVCQAELREGVRGVAPNECVTEPRQHVYLDAISSIADSNFMRSMVKLEAGKVGRGAKNGDEELRNTICGEPIV